MAGRRCWADAVITAGIQDGRTAKRHTTGCHRGRAPAETLARAERWKTRCGVTRVANVTGLDRIGYPVFVAIRPNARSLATAQGKGPDETSARASALMESIEMWHAENIDVQRVHGSYADLSPRMPVLDPDLLPRPEGANIHAEQPLAWIEGHDLLTGEALWVPLETATLDLVLAPSQRHAFPPTSNGLASGNSLIEAIVHGLCEVIERDSVHLWQEKGGASLSHLRVDSSAVEDASCRAALDRLRDAGVLCALWDVTSDVGAPAYAAEILDDTTDPFAIRTGAFGGYGCHPAPEIALLRAITEAIQSRLTFISGSRDDLFRDRYRAPRDLLATHAGALRRGTARGVLSERESLATDTFEGDLRRLLDRVARIGIQHVIAVDLSRPDMDLSVVKVIVPGLLPQRTALRWTLGPRARGRAPS